MDSRVTLGLAVCLTALLLGSGGYLAYSTFTQQTQANTAVEATVLSSEFEPEGRFDDDFYVFIEYQYTYDGETYTSSNIYPGASSRVIDDEQRAREIVQQYPAGEAVTAYVNGDDPTESYLIEADTGGTALGTVVLLGLGVIALLGTVAYGAGVVFDLFQPGPKAVTLSRAEVRHQLLSVFEDIDEYPIDSTRAIRQSSLDRTRAIDLHEFEVTVGTLDSLLDSDLDTACESPEELTEAFLAAMEAQGYFSAATPST
jgi:hypothetical protein